MLGRPMDERIRVRERLRDERLTRWYSDASEWLRRHPLTPYEIVAGTMLRKWGREIAAGDEARFAEAHQVLAAAFLGSRDRWTEPTGEPVPVLADADDNTLNAAAAIGPGEACAWCLLTALLTAGVVSNPVLAKYYWPALLSGWGIIAAFIYLRVRQ